MSETNISVDGLVMRQFTNGMTVRELKELIRDWPETNNFGQDCEVWIETGRGLSSLVTASVPLNVAEDKDRNVSADIFFKSGKFNA